MAPKEKAAPKDTPKEVSTALSKDAQFAEKYAAMKTFFSRMALLQLFYVLYRTFWHVGLPWYFGAPQYVPLVLELCAAQLLVSLFCWAAGGFGPVAKERDMMLKAYNLLAFVVFAKCVTDLFIYNFSPHLWQHYRADQPWGVYSVLEVHMPEFLQAWGMKPADFSTAVQSFERGMDTICLLMIFKGIQAGKNMVLARREQMRRKQAQREKKQEKEEEKKALTDKKDD